MENTKAKLPLRTIKSFVVRGGRLSKAQQYAVDNYWEQYVLSPQENFYDFTKIFPKEQDTFLEIGFGMGESLFSIAKNNPQINFIGIDVHKPGVANVLKEIVANNLTNVRLFCYDAVTVLEKCIPDNFLSCVLVFFPDPWPKLRHHKRRLINTDFVKLLSQKLKLHGEIFLATDWEDYANQVLKVFAKNSEFINKAWENNFSPKTKWRFYSKFEQKGESCQRKIWDLGFVKTK